MSLGEKLWLIGKGEQIPVFVINSSMELKSSGDFFFFFFWFITHSLQFCFVGNCHWFLDVANCLGKRIRKIWEDNGSYMSLWLVFNVSLRFIMLSGSWTIKMPCVCFWECLNHFAISSCMWKRSSFMFFAESTCCFL